jgi:hypothetical protein
MKKKMRYYIAGPIQGFLRKTWNFKNYTEKQILFMNWDAALKWGHEMVLKLHQMGIDNVFSPQIYTIQLAKAAYDKIGNDREYWLKLDLGFIADFMKGDAHMAYVECCKNCDTPHKLDGYYQSVPNCECKTTSWIVQRQIYDSGITILMSKIAYEDQYLCLHCNIPLTDIKKEEGYCVACTSNELLNIPHREWRSKGCEIEYNYAKKNHIQVLDLDSFLERREVEV